MTVNEYSLEDENYMVKYDDMETPRQISAQIKLKQINEWNIV